MNIGIDFDNTIVDYTGVFYRVACSLGWIPASIKSDKTSVRDYLRQEGHEARWIELQGLIYGPHIFEAKPFDGALAFFDFCRQKGIRPFIISHKTRSPFMGEVHDLHYYALEWLERNQFFTEKSGIPKKDVFLEVTKEAKMHRIAELQCDYFIDDLPEFLNEANFPSAVQRILFDPHGQYEAHSFCQRVASWSSFIGLLS